MKISKSEQGIVIRRGLRRASRQILHPADAHLLRSFPMFTPASAGPARDLAAAAIQGAAQIFPLLLAVAAPDGRAAPAAVPIASFASSDSKRRAAATLQKLLDRYGSDKALRALTITLNIIALLCEPESVKALLEIGLGTRQARSLEQVRGRPPGRVAAGISRDFLQNAQIYSRHRPPDPVHRRPDRNSSSPTRPTRHPSRPSSRKLRPVRPDHRRRPALPGREAPSFASGYRGQEVPAAG